MPSLKDLDESGKAKTPSVGPDGATALTNSAEDKRERAILFACVRDGGLNRFISKEEIKAIIKGSWYWASSSCRAPQRGETKFEAEVAAVKKTALVVNGTKMCESKRLHLLGALWPSDDPADRSRSILHIRESKGPCITGPRHHAAKLYPPIAGFLNAAQPQPRHPFPNWFLMPFI